MMSFLEILLTHQKASDETINKTYVEYKQRELNEKGEKPGRGLGGNYIIPVGRDEILSRFTGIPAVL